MEKDLTTGNITPQLIRFTIPLVLGNIFQLMYNAIDSIIVGRFVGSQALAAVGICNPISTLFILFLNGLCMGASILMGNMFGAKEYDKLHRQISTTMISGIIFSLTLSVLCILFAHPILTLMQVDSVIISMTKLYLHIIFSGLIFTLMYLFPAVTNGVQGYFRGIGDLKITLISSFVNMSVRVIFAAILVFYFSLQIEALPFSYLAGWIGMLVAEIPLLLKKF